MEQRLCSEQMEETNEETAEEEENNAIADKWYTGNSQ
jgi:hypothetical protein